MTTTETTTETPNDDPHIDRAHDTAAIDNYVAAWNETDEAKRGELLRAAVGADLWYRDPMLEADSREAFSATLSFVQQNFPDHVLTRTSGVDAHHDLVRFNWAFGLPGEAPVLAGVDVAKYDADGKLHRVIGFAGETVASL